MDPNITNYKNLFIPDKLSTDSLIKHTLKKIDIKINRFIHLLSHGELVNNKKIVKSLNKDIKLLKTNLYEKIDQSSDIIGNISKLNQAVSDLKSLMKGNEGGAHVEKNLSNSSLELENLSKKLTLLENQVIRFKAIKERQAVAPFFKRDEDEQAKANDSSSNAINPPATNLIPNAPDLANQALPLKESDSAGSKEIELRDKKKDTMIFSLIKKFISKNEKSFSPEFRNERQGERGSVSLKKVEEFIRNQKDSVLKDHFEKLLSKIEDNLKEIDKQN